MAETVNYLVFGWYPYLCLTVFLLGSLVRFDREQYTWRSGSSQLLRRRRLRLGSNLFHIGVLFLLFGHAFGMLTPHWAYEAFLGAGAKQLLAMISGGIAGALAFLGLTLLLHRRLADPRIRATSSAMDITVVLLLWIQLALGLATIPFSAHHLDGSMMLLLAEWAQHIVTFRSGAADLVAFGRAFTANPDLVEKLRTNARLALPDPKTFYSGGAGGYIDAVALKT